MTNCVFVCFFYLSLLNMFRRVSKIFELEIFLPVQIIWKVISELCFSVL